jgi:hypothetical protein
MIRFITFFLLSLIVNQAIASVPAWISSGNIAEYSNHQRYIVAIANGESLSVTEKLAFAKLAEQVKVDIAGQSEIAKGFRSSGDETTEYESIDVEVKSSVMLEGVEGIQIVARYLDTDSSQHYVFAVLDKFKTSNALAFQLDDLFRQVDRSESDVDQFFKSGNPSKGFRSLIKINELFKSIQSDLIMYQLFAEPDKKALENKRFLDRTRSHDLLLSKTFTGIRALVDNGDVKSGSSGLGVEEPFALSFKYDDQPIRFIPIKIDAEASGYQFDVDEATDGNGKLSVKIKSLPYTGSKVNLIKVGLALSNEIFNSFPPSADLTVILNQKSDTTIRLSTQFSDAIYLDFAPMVDTNLTQLLSEHDYNMAQPEEISKHDYVLNVRAKVSEYPGYGGLKFVKISGVVEIKSLKTNKLLKIVHIDSEATKAGGLSTYEAAEKSASLVADAVRDELLDTLESVIGR